MPKEPDEIPAETDPPSTGAVVSSALTAPPFEATSLTLELSEVDYLTGVRECLGEWASAEDDGTFDSL